MFYLDHYTDEFDRTRSEAKGRAKAATLTSAIATAFIAVVGAATAITGWTWLGIVSTVLAGVVSVVGAWDGLFRHRELWLQRSRVLGQLQQLQREIRTELEMVDAPPRDVIAQRGLEQLNSVLADDLESWQGISRKGASAHHAN